MLKSPNLLKSISIITKSYAKQLPRLINSSWSRCDGAFHSKVVGYKHALLQNKY